MQPLQDTSKPLPVCLVFPGLISSGQDSEPHVQESKPVLAGQGAQYVGMLQKQKDIPALLRKLPMVLYLRQTSLHSFPFQNRQLGRLSRALLHPDRIALQDLPAVKAMLAKAKEATSEAQDVGGDNQLGRHRCVCS